MRWLGGLLLVVGFMVIPLSPADAHRDGCHRWHSCPSDTGSYVCGDLGDFSECPDSPPSPKTESDFDPPKTPRLVHPTSKAGGRVTLTVQAEKGSQIRVESESGRRVATVTATGDNQRISLRAKTGRHTYSVTATDQAGNESYEATKGVTVDATAPKLTNLTARPGTDVTGASTLAFSSEPSARWTLYGAADKPLHGTAKTGTTNMKLWLPNGTYRLKLSAQDRIGNTARKTIRMRVRVVRPLLRIERTSDLASRHLTYVMTGTPRSAGRLVLEHLADAPFRIDDHGTATVAFDTADGSYGPGLVTLTDFAGRRTSQPLPEVVVDTSPPKLDLVADDNLAKTGTLALTATAESGAIVHVYAELPGTALDQTATAGSTPLTYSRRPPAGIYTITATARDQAENTTERRAVVEVVVPSTPAEIAVGLILLLLLIAIPVVAGIVAWRQRDRIRAWRVRRLDLAQQRAAARAGAAAEAAYQQQLRNHQQALAAHQAADANWQREHDHLAQLARLAETFRPTADAAGLIHLKTREASYGAFRATMVEERTRQGTTTLVDAAAGDVIITSQRVAFIADKKRDWTYNKLQAVQNSTHDLTLLTVSNRKTRSGVRVSPAASQQFRLQLDLAIADGQGSRAAVIARCHQQLSRHQLGRPVPPTPPPPPVRAEPVDVE